MPAIDPHDEFIHQDYPRDDPTPWKENWYFNFIDREHNAWGINHISLERHKQKGRFSAFHVVDGKILMYANTISLDDDFTELTDGTLAVEFVEPLTTFRLTFAGPHHRVDLTYEKRFDVFDYAGEKKGRAPRGDKNSLAINHYEQGLTVTGTLTKNGESRPISCHGHRDHSWGYRNERKISGWNWVAVQFPERTINLSQVRVGKAYMNRGFVSDAEGNTGIRAVKVLSTERDKTGAPTTSTFEATDESGRTWTLTSRKFSGLVLPMREKGSRVVVYENFADYSLAETGEDGVGIDEYLDNPDM